MSKILIFDGAMGTMLQQRGLLPGQSPEELNLTMPDVVESVHADYRRQALTLLPPIPLAAAALNCGSMI